MTQLKSFIDRLERLNEDKAAIQEDIKATMAEAKATGLDPKIIRKVLKLRKMEQAERQEVCAITDLYMTELGDETEVKPGDIA